MPPAPATPAPARSEEKESRGARRRRLGVPRRITPRVIGFVLLVVAVPVGVYFAIKWYAYDNWYVTLQGDQIVVKQGQQGGVLWFKPKVVDHTGHTSSQVPSLAVGPLRAGVQEGSLTSAQSYVRRLLNEATTTTTTTTTLKTTTTTPSNHFVPAPPPTTAPPTTAATTTTTTAAAATAAVQTTTTQTVQTHHRGDRRPGRHRPEARREAPDHDHQPAHDHPVRSSRPGLPSVGSGAMQPVDTPRVYSGRYELTHLIARGGMAQVYRAMDRQLDRPVALKVLFPELSVDRTFVERFRREAQAAANLSHPNIVPVFDWGEDDGTYFIVMEYVDGRALSAVLRDPTPLPPRQIATIGAGVAAALAFAHRHGVIHRDVKPGNVLITPEGEVKVTDFGIARAVNTEESLTQTGAVMGTAAYFSPEQAEGKGVDSRSDIYSLGVVLYEMSVGRPPFTGDSPVAVASKHVRDTPVLPREANPAVPAALEAVVMKAMAKNPDDRYATAEELRADLLRFAEGRPVEAGDPGVTSMMTTVGAAAGATQATRAITQTGRTMAVLDGAAPPASREDLERRKRTRNLVILLVVLLAALAIIAFFLLRSVLGGNVTVPNVVGQSQQQATQTLQNDHLTVGSTTSELNDFYGKGTVVATDPKEGTSLAKNSSVKLVLSAGAGTPVPKVTGLQLTPATQLIQDAGLNYTVKYVTSNEPVGTVLAQSPNPGTKIAPSQKVNLTVSGTQTSVSVPSVLGQSAASAGIDAEGCGSQRGLADQWMPERSISRRRGGGPVTGAEHARPAQQFGQHPGVQLCRRPERRRPDVVLGPVGHQRCRPGGQHDLRHHVRQQRAAGQRRQPDAGRGRAGGQRQHGEHLGVPVEHDDHDDHVDHDADVHVVDSAARSAGDAADDQAVALRPTTGAPAGRRLRRPAPPPAVPGSWPAAPAPTPSAPTRGGTGRPRPAASGGAVP